jgi:protein-tyrosine phosphatase
MEKPSLQAGMRNQVFWITHRIAQGIFATHERAQYLRSQGVTHILNVGESPSIIEAEKFGFQKITDCPVPDFQRIPDCSALACLDALHEMLCETNSKVYVHCVAGQNRSPTILWLYFIACGMTSAEAKSLICNHTLDAVPGHSQLVDEQLIATVIAHGKERYLPFLDYDILTPAY